MYKREEYYKRWNFVYWPLPHYSSLLMGTSKCRQDFVGPLVVDTVFDCTISKLRDLENRILADVCHINRLKPATLDMAQSYDAVGSDHLAITRKWFIIYFGQSMQWHSFQSDISLKQQQLALSNKMGTTYECKNSHLLRQRLELICISVIQYSMDIWKIASWWNATQLIDFDLKSLCWFVPK